jgi:type I restriction enzyme S subunit
MRDLPAGWRRATLGELGVDARPGFASGTHNSEGNGLVHLRPMNITRDGRIDLNDVRYVQDTTDRRVRAGDVLFNNTNSPALVGKTALVTSETPLAYSNHMTRLRPPAELRSDFLAYQLHWLWAEGYFKTVLNNHVNQASVASARLLETSIDFPSLTEQRRIVEELERYLARTEDGLSSLRRVEALLSSWRGATLAQAFRGNLVEDDLAEGNATDLSGLFALESSEAPWMLPDQWAWRRMGDLFTVSVGATPSRSDASLWGGGIPWVSSGEVAFNRI